MSLRPYLLHTLPPVKIEIKYGYKNEKGFPQRLEHFKIVDREKGGEKNYPDCTEVYEALGSDKPKSVPIVLMSDDVAENFALFRGVFDKTGNVICGSKYGEKLAKRRVQFNETYDRIKPIDIPEMVTCDDKCPIWNSGKCDLFGSLYFRLGSDLPRSGDFGIVRVKGAYGKKYLASSLEILKAQTGGILANLPLVLSMHTESKRAANGNTYKVPMLTINPGIGNSQFMEAVMQEYERRAKMFRIRNSKDHSDISDLMITDVLRDISSREGFTDEAINDEPEIVGETVYGDGSQSEPIVIPPSIQKILDGLPDRRREIMERQVNGLPEADALKILSSADVI